MGLRERTRKEKQKATCAASVSSMRTVEENSTLLPDNEMEVDAGASSAAAAPAAGLQTVLRVRGTSREPSDPDTAPPGGSGGDGVVPQSSKRKEKEKEELTRGRVDPWNWQEYDKVKKQQQPQLASTTTTRAPTRETSLQAVSGTATPALDTKEEAALRARGQALMENANVKTMLKTEAAQMTCAPSAPQPDDDDDGEGSEDDGDKELPQVSEHPDRHAGRRSCFDGGRQENLSMTCEFCQRSSTMFSIFIYVKRKEDVELRQKGEYYWTWHPAKVHDPDFQKVLNAQRQQELDEPTRKDGMIAMLDSETWLADYKDASGGSFDSGSTIASSTCVNDTNSPIESGSGRLTGTTCPYALTERQLFSTCN
eukprot:6363216-Amphidinium_carterae.1